MSRVIDLTIPLRSGMRGVGIETARTLEKDGWNATTLRLYSHAGTHMDAPLHFGVSDETVDQIPLEKCMVPAWIVDLAGIAPRRLITPQHLGKTESKIKTGEGLLLRTGWSAYVGQEKYRNELPRVSVELARWCVERELAILGVEPPSVADVNNIEELSAVHSILMQGGVVIVEGLTNLQAIAKEKVMLMALPLKITGGDGAPVRAVAIEQ